MIDSLLFGSDVNTTAVQFVRFLKMQSMRLAETGDGYPIHISPIIENAFQFDNHFLVSGKGPIVFFADDELPSSLEEGRHYWPVVIDSDHFGVSKSQYGSTRADLIEIQNNGAGQLYFSYAADVAALFQRILAGTDALDIQNASTIDEL